ncbi:MAG: YfiT family bacillithiol transferase [Bacteroidota bacterium]
MSTVSLEQLKYPIGPYHKPEHFSDEDLASWIHSIENLPGQLIELTADLDSEQLAWIYRPEGWSIKQVVHHLADSHINCWARFKLALTEEHPTIRPYDEVSWAKLPDGNDDDLSDSLTLLTGLHARLTKTLRNIQGDQWNRTLVHPANQEVFDIAQLLAMYAWHSDHHAAHIEQALAHENHFS